MDVLKLPVNVKEIATAAVDFFQKCCSGQLLERCRQVTDLNPRLRHHPDQWAVRSNGENSLRRTAPGLSETGVHASE